MKAKRELLKSGCGYHGGCRERLDGNLERFYRQFS